MRGYKTGIAWILKHEPLKPSPTLDDVAAIAQRQCVQLIAYLAQKQPEEIALEMVFGALLPGKKLDFGSTAVQPEKPRSKYSPVLDLTRGLETTQFQIRIPEELPKRLKEEAIRQNKTERLLLSEILDEALPEVTGV